MSVLSATVLSWASSSSSSNLATMRSATLLLSSTELLTDGLSSSVNNGRSVTDLVDAKFELEYENSELATLQCRLQSNLVPRPQRGGEKRPGTYCMRMCKVPQQNLGLRIRPYISRISHQYMSVNYSVSFR